MPFCRMCGAELPDGSKFCSQCGSAVQETQATETDIAQDSVAYAASSSAEAVPASSPAPKKKPFYTRWWFIALAVIALVAIVFSVATLSARSSFKNQPFADILASYGDFEETTVTGYGDDIVDIPCAGSPCLIDVGFDGVYYYGYEGGHFSIWAVDKAGNNLDLLANRIGPFSETTTTWNVGEAATSLNVNADAGWSITFRPLSSMEIVESGYSSHGSNVIGIDTDKISEVSFTHSGSSNFIVYGIGLDSGALLANGVGLFKGTVQWNQPKAMFIVEADGDWTIEWS